MSVSLHHNREIQKQPATRPKLEQHKHEHGCKNLVPRAGERIGLNRAAVFQAVACSRALQAAGVDRRK
eukprot:11887012-Heterocapsa_arctica.AAC.1